MSVPGLQLHFISEDFQHGGHVFECIPQKVTAGIQLINKLELSLPMFLDYLKCDFHQDIQKELDKAEK